MQLNPTSLTTIIIASSHVEERNNGVAPTGYAFSLSPGGAEPHWGFGGARDTQEMLAQGLNRAAELAFFDDEDAVIDVVVRTLGVRKYLTEFLPKWRPQMASNPAFSRNNIPAWERLHNLSLLGSLEIRLPANAEKQLVEDMQRLAKEAASRALQDFRQNRARYARAGVFMTDKDKLDATAS